MGVYDRYQNWELVGKGGMARVYKVFDAELNINVAIKLLNEDARKNEALREGLKHEVTISYDIPPDKRICRLYGLYDNNDEFGIIMELIQGNETKDWIKENKGKLFETAQIRFDFIRLMAGALEVIHQKIVHRDLKPGNIFLRDRNLLDPVLMDFGISFKNGIVNDNVAGTPTYMAPEQYLVPEKVDARSDLFSFGIICYELFTDSIPLCSLRGVMKNEPIPHLRIDEIPPPSQFCPKVPPALDELILRMLSYDKEARPDSAAEVLAVLNSVNLLSDEEALERTKGKVPEREKILIPGGAYYFGSGADSSNENEKPARKVMLDGFEIDSFPVTNADYANFAKATGRPLPPLFNDPTFGKADHPVVGITWEEAKSFAEWSGGRLPTEAEWECAARGGVRFAEYPWGNDAPSNNANIDCIRDTTTPINAFPNGKNPLGLWDMCGNVWEWCEDSYDPGFLRGMAKDCLNPKNVGRPNDPKLLKGGSFESFAKMGRCAFKSSAAKGERRRDIGFRLVYDKK